MISINSLIYVKNKSGSPTPLPWITPQQEWQAYTITLDSATKQFGN